MLLLMQAKAIAVDALRRENEERLLADARLAAELDAELLKEEQVRRQHFKYSINK